MLAFLSLDQIGGVIGEIVVWWTQLVKGIPPENLPLYAYVGFSIVVLLLWILVVRVLPKTLAGLSWIILCAILLTPTTSLGTPPDIAPASISVVYGILLKDPAIIFNGLLPIMIVITVGCILGFLWQIVRMGMDKMHKKPKVADNVAV
ncbi:MULTISPECIES: resolvase [unclassified Moraxella]|uniref:resolvase n=1 Tax=unclassified Moraxella TaxID=2685852 RepID=UPI003AF8A943